MTTDKLKEIIEDKNRDLERETVREAEKIIGEIGRLRSNIKNAEAQIRDLQANLKKLEITQLDPISILGA